MVSSSILQNASSMAGVLRHLAVARGHLNGHNITAVVSSLRSQGLGDGGDELSVGGSALEKLLTGLQLRAHHVGQGLEIAEKNRLDDELAIEHLHVLRLHVAPGIDLLHVVGDSVILGNGALLLGVHDGGNLLGDYRISLT